MSLVINNKTYRPRGDLKYIKPELYIMYSESIKKSRRLDKYNLNKNMYRERSRQYYKMNRERILTRRRELRHINNNLT